MQTYEQRVEALENEGLTTSDAQAVIEAEDMKAANEAYHARIAETLEAASLAFWEQVAKAYPEITTGDFDPGATFDIEQAMQEAIELWVEYNTPRP